MPLVALDHVNLCTGALERQLAFYENVLGLKRGPRPEFNFDGAWLYLGERPLVHLVVVSAPPEPSGQLRIAHFAFHATGLIEFVARLRAAGVSFRLRVQPTFGVRQINMSDPDGNKVHVDFAASEPLPDA